jgi:hypothetical protein
LATCPIAAGSLALGRVYASEPDSIAVNRQHVSIDESRHIK